MKKKNRRRINNSSKHLKFFLQENDNFFIGLLFEDYLKCENLNLYKLPSQFLENKTIVPEAKGPVTKVNIKGKFIRKQPEEKTTKQVHIKYFKKDGTQIEYDRNYNVYIKELLHKYNLSLTFLTNKHGQKIVTTDKLDYKDDPKNNIKNTHVINLFCEIFNDFEVFNSELEPAIHFNKKFEMDLLPKGTLNDDNLKELTEFAGRYTKNKEVQMAFQKRLHILKQFNPDIRGKGPSNFFGYIVFGFSELNIIVLETMYSGNATYIFNLTDYESNIIKDKQSVLKDKTMIARFYHYDNWESRIKAYLNKLKNKK